MSKKKKKKEWTSDFEEAWDIYSAPVQCGDCYVYYDPTAHENCPNCGGEDWVGSR